MRAMGSTDRQPEVLVPCTLHNFNLKLVRLSVLKLFYLFLRRSTCTKDVFYVYLYAWYDAVYGTFHPELFYYAVNEFFTIIIFGENGEQNAS